MGGDQTENLNCTYAKKERRILVQTIKLKNKLIMCNESKPSNYRDNPLSFVNHAN